MVWRCEGGGGGRGGGGLHGFVKKGISSSRTSITRKVCLRVGGKEKSEALLKREKMGKQIS